MSKPVDRVWLGEDPTAPLTDEATPSASLALLNTAISYPLDAACMPYVGCGRLFDGCSILTTGERYIGQMVAPGASHGQASISGCVTSYGSPTGTGSPYNYLSWTNYGGTTGVHVVTVNVATDLPGLAYSEMMPRAFYFGCFAQRSLITTSDQIDDAPTVAEDRRYQFQSLGYPYVEPMKITNAAGFSVCMNQRVLDLDIL